MVLVSVWGFLIYFLAVGLTKFSLVKHFPLFPAGLCDHGVEVFNRDAYHGLCLAGAEGTAWGGGR